MSTLRVIASEWLPAATMKRIIVHWTAGGHEATEFDRGHYHILINADGALVRGIPPISGNSESKPKGRKASHTLNCNTGSIGVSLCCMGGAVESPFNAGRWPMTRAQWDTLMPVLADLCDRYGIPVTPRTVLSHAEVQVNLGIKQRGKWDIARLAFDPTVVGAKACGDIFRKRTSSLLAQKRPMQFVDVGFDADDDGGEPHEPVVEFPTPPIVGAQSNEGLILATKKKLAQVGYFEFGILNGDWGGKTVAAIAAYKNDRGLSGPAAIDDVLTDQLDKDIASGWTRPIGTERATITAPALAKESRAAKKTLGQWIAAKWTALTTLVGAAITGISNQFETASSYVAPVRDLFADVPGWCWLLAIAGVAGGVWYASRRATEDIVEAKRTGRLN
jgi:hypothetical protein